VVWPPHGGWFRSRGWLSHPLATMGVANFLFFYTTTHVNPQELTHSGLLVF